MIAARLTAVTVLGAMALAGCGSMEMRRDAAEITPELHDLPKVEARPLHAGIYYSPEFAGEERVRAMGPSIMIMPIGAASVQLFEGTFPRLFARTTRVSALAPAELAAKGVDVAISPTLEYFNWKHDVFDADGPSLRWSVSYRITLYDRSAVPIASWIVTGDDTKSGAWFPESVRKDLRDAAVKFLDGFGREAGPALAAMARRNNGQAGSIDSGVVTLTAGADELPRLDPKAVAALRSAGLAAVRVTARNVSDRGLLMRASDMRLRMKDGRLIEPLSMNSILNVLEDKEQAYDASFGGVFFFGSLGGFAASMADVQTQADQREKESGTIRASLFSERSLGKGGEASGIVLFRIPRGADAIAAATLTVWAVDSAAAQGVQIEIPVPGLKALPKDPSVREVAQGAADRTMEAPGGAAKQQTGKETVEAPGRKEAERTPSPSDSAFPALTNPRYWPTR